VQNSRFRLQIRSGAIGRRIATGVRGQWGISSDDQGVLIYNLLIGHSSWDLVCRQITFPEIQIMSHYNRKYDMVDDLDRKDFSLSELTQPSSRIHSRPFDEIWKNS